MKKQKHFVNEAKPLELSAWRADQEANPKWDGGSYRYDRPSKYLFHWGRLLQNVLSQVLSRTMGSGYHNHDPGIFKCEGGLNLIGCGHLTLHGQYCIWDSYHGGRIAKVDAQFAADVISKVVLAWDPMDPIQSMFTAALEAAGIKEPGIDKNEDHELAQHMIKHQKRFGAILSVFGGNSLADFFNWNPFSKPPIDRPYQRWCLTNLAYGNQQVAMTDADVDQLWADEDKTEALREQINEAAEKKGGRFANRVIGMKHVREGDQVRYFINMGKDHRLQGWHDEADIKQAIAAGEI